jgi:hypothetical protein
MVDASADTNRWSTPGGWRPSTSTGGSPGAVDPAPLAQSFALWQAAHFTPVEQADPSVSGPEADPDGDGRLNFEEYALVLDPHHADPSCVLGPVIVNGRGTVTFNRLTFAPDVVYRIETADDLTGPWRLGSAELAQAVIGYDGLTHKVLATILAPVGGGGPRFLRLIIEFDRL